MKPEHKEIIVKVSIAVILALIGHTALTANSNATKLENMEAQLAKPATPVTVKAECKYPKSEPITIKFRGVEQVP